MAKTFTGDAWSSDEFSSYSYSVTIDKDEAEKLLRAMDVAKSIDNGNTIDFHDIRVWFNGDFTITGGDDVTCDVAIARVKSDEVYFEFKNKYTADVYETDSFYRKQMEEAIAEAE